MQMLKSMNMSSTAKCWLVSNLGQLFYTSFIDVTLTLILICFEKPKTDVCVTCEEVQVWIDGIEDPNRR